MVQHEAPYVAYPTPPPASVPFSSSSSSLANALGSPIAKKIAPNRKDSLGSKNHLSHPAHFFDSFLNERLKELSNQCQPDSKPFPVSSSVLGAVPSSPVFQRNGAASKSSLLVGTPRSSPKKRKLVEVVIETPSKRSTAFPPLDGSLQEHERKPTTPRAPRMQVFVEITPSKSSVTPMRSHGSVVGSSPDLGGYGPEEGSGFLTRKQEATGVRSSGKRTGERDDRGT